MNDVLRSVADAVSTAVTMGAVLFGLGFFTVSYMRGIDGLLANWAGMQHYSEVVGLGITGLAFVMAFANVFALLSFAYSFRATLRANRALERVSSSGNR